MAASSHAVEASRRLAAPVMEEAKLPPCCGQALSSTLSNKVAIIEAKQTPDTCFQQAVASELQWQQSFNYRSQQGTHLWLSQEVQQKIEKQCDADLEQTPIQWITTQCHKDVGQPQPGRENSQNRFKGGSVLCEPTNRLHPEGQAPVKKIQACTTAFKQMEQISQFLQVAES
ncbi:Transgelin-2 [Myotis davidii]|uniref:Transgelin-2 n=1 Tax=Myotis davidii TaxID=225400 RepID=L5LFT0_MYODS|nr:Transgelin-2 [Myotis davidii]